LEIETDKGDAFGDALAVVDEFILAGVFECQEREQAGVVT
jgi:hypothetical protein